MLYRHLKGFIPSSVSSRGYKIDPVSVCVCVCVCQSVCQHQTWAEAGFGFTKPAFLGSRLRLRLPRFLRVWLRLRDFQRLRLRGLPKLRLCNQNLVEGVPPTMASCLLPWLHFSANLTTSHLESWLRDLKFVGQEYWQRGHDAGGPSTLRCFYAYY